MKAIIRRSPILHVLPQGPEESRTDGDALRDLPPVPVAVAQERPALTRLLALAHHDVIERDPNATRFYLDGALSDTASVTGQADYAVMIRNSLQTSALEVDWIRARARVAPDPAVLPGVEEPL